MQAGLSTARLAMLGGAPVEAIDDQDEALLARQKDDVAAAHFGILEMRRNDGEVILVERDQLERLGGQHLLDVLSRARSGKGGDGGTYITTTVVPTLTRS